jgi:hypothetical protein
MLQLEEALMTRRARWTRPFIALFALWFAVVLGDPGLLHSCPMHGGHGAAHAAASAGDVHQAHGAHGAHASDDVASAGAMQHDAQHDAQQSAPHHGKTGPCTCVGHCCAVSAVASVPATSAVHVPTTLARAEQPLVVALGHAPAAPDTRLPFANGPPTA